MDERLRLRDDLLHRAAAVVHAAHRRVRAFPEAQDGGHRGRLLLGCGLPLAGRHDGVARARHAQDGQHPGHPHDAAERVLRPQRQDRRVQHPPARARPPLRDRRGQHHVGQRLPPPRGHLALHARVPQGTVLGHPDRRDRADPRAQPGRLLRLRPRRARAHRRARSAPPPRTSARPTRRCSPSGSRSRRPDVPGSPAPKPAPASPTEGSNERAQRATRQVERDPREPLDPGAPRRRGRHRRGVPAQRPPRGGVPHRPRGARGGAAAAAHARRPSRGCGCTSPASRSTDTSTRSSARSTSTRCSATGSASSAR